MIYIKVREGLLEVLFAEKVFEFEAGDDEFGQIDIPGAVRVDHPHEETHPSFGNSRLGFQS